MTPVQKVWRVFRSGRPAKRKTDPINGLATFSNLRDQLNLQLTEAGLPPCATLIVFRFEKMPKDIPAYSIPVKKGTENDALQMMLSKSGGKVLGAIFGLRDDKAKNGPITRLYTYPLDWQDPASLKGLDWKWKQELERGKAKPKD